MISLFQMNVCLAVFTTTVAILALGLLIYVLITNNVHAAASVTKDVEKPHNNLIYKPKSGDEVIDIEKEGLPRMRSERSLKEVPLTFNESPIEVEAASGILEAQYDDPIEDSQESEYAKESVAESTTAPESTSTIEPPFVKVLVEPECSPNSSAETDTRC